MANVEATMTSPNTYASSLQVFLLMTSSLACNVRMERDRPDVGNTTELAVAAPSGPETMRADKYRWDCLTSVNILCNFRNKDGWDLFNRHLRSLPTSLIGCGVGFFVFVFVLFWVFLLFCFVLFFPRVRGLLLKLQLNSIQSTLFIPHGALHYIKTGWWRN